MDYDYFSDIGHLPSFIIYSCYAGGFRSNKTDYMQTIKFNYISYVINTYLHDNRTSYIVIPSYDGAFNIRINQTEISRLLSNSSSFLYLITHNEFLNEIYKYYFDFNFNNTKMKFYKEDYNKFYILECERPVNINLVYKTYLEYDEILTALDNLKNIKKSLLTKLFKQSMKFADYAEEECIVSEKLLNVISRQIKYDKFNDDLTTFLTLSPIQKHTFCVCLETAIDMPEISINTFSNDFKIIYEKMYFKQLF